MPDKIEIEPKDHVGGVVGENPVALFARLEFLLVSLAGCNIVVGADRSALGKGRRSNFQNRAVRSR